MDRLNSVNYYEDLKIPMTADEATIKSAFVRLALARYAGNAPVDANATRKFQQVSHQPASPFIRPSGFWTCRLTASTQLVMAFTQLMDRSFRPEYDRVLRRAEENKRRALQVSAPKPKRVGFAI